MVGRFKVDPLKSAALSPKLGFGSSAHYPPTDICDSTFERETEHLGYWNVTQLQIFISKLFKVFSRIPQCQLSNILSISSI